MARGVDTIVLGLGAMGSAAIHQLARSGRRVLGIDQFEPPHDRGSSHGGTRIMGRFRQIYFENPDYFHAFACAMALWEQLEREADEPLRRKVGGLLLGPPHAQVGGAIHAAQKHGTALNVLSATEIRRRFPVLAPPESFLAIHEEDAQVIRPEASIEALLKGAVKRGAELRTRERVVDWSAHPGGVEVSTERGRIEAETLVITPGPWAPRVLSDLGLPLQVDRVAMYWFEPQGGVAGFGSAPVHVWDTLDGERFFCFPALDGEGGGVKLGVHAKNAACTPETLRAEPTPEELEKVRGLLERYVPRMNGKFLRSSPCLYTNTPDQHFVIGRHPAHPNVSVAAGFSGHGFKFASWVGAVLRDLASSGATREPIALFSPARFRGSAGTSTTAS